MNIFSIVRIKFIFIYAEIDIIQYIIYLKHVSLLIHFN